MVSHRGLVDGGVSVHLHAPLAVVTFGGSVLGLFSPTTFVSLVCAGNKNARAVFHVSLITAGPVSAGVVPGTGFC